MCCTSRSVFHCGRSSQRYLRGPTSKQLCVSRLVSSFVDLWCSIGLLGCFGSMPHPCPLGLPGMPTLECASSHCGAATVVAFRVCDESLACACKALGYSRAREILPLEARSRWSNFGALFPFRSVYWRQSQLQAVVLVADKKFSLKVTGLGDVLAPNGGVIGESQTQNRSLWLLNSSTAACQRFPVWKA